MIDTNNSAPRADWLDMEIVRRVMREDWPRVNRPLSEAEMIEIAGQVLDYRYENARLGIVMDGGKLSERIADHFGWSYSNVARRGAIARPHHAQRMAEAKARRLSYEEGQRVSGHTKHKRSVPWREAARLKAAAQLQACA